MLEAAVPCKKVFSSRGNFSAIKKCSYSANNQVSHIELRIFNIDKLANILELYKRFKNFYEVI